MLLILFILAFSSSVQCKMEGFIVGGKQTSIARWPFITFIEGTIQGEDKTAEPVLACGGSLLSSQTVLTAAHCLDDPTNKKKIMNQVRFIVYMGHNELEKATMARRAIDFETCPTYDPERQDVRCDIGVLFLSSPVKFSDTVKKVILFNHKFKSKRDRDLVVAGWGKSSPEDTDPLNTISPILKEAKVRSVSSKECLRLCPFVDVDAVICIEDSKDYAYRGDSGGPLVKQDSYFQIGIVSFQHEESRSTIYTHVPAYYNWIKKTQQKLFKKHCK